MDGRTNGQSENIMPYAFACQSGPAEA